MAYDNNIPQPTDVISNSQGDLLANFMAIDSGTTGTGIGFSRNHVTMTDATNGGLHSRVDFYVALASPTITGFISSLYPKTVTNVEAFYKNGSADIQLSNSLLTASSGQGMLPGGLQIRCGFGSVTSGSTQLVTWTATPFPVAPLAALACGIGNDNIFSVVLGSLTTTQVTFHINGSAVAEFYWIALGY